MIRDGLLGEPCLLTTKQLMICEFLASRACARLFAAEKKGALHFAIYSMGGDD